MNKESSMNHDSKRGEDLKKEAASYFGSKSDSLNGSVKDVIGKAIEEFGKYLAEKKEDLEEGAIEYSDKYMCKARRKIKENPLASIAGALAIGAAVSLICSAMCKRNN